MPPDEVRSFARQAAICCSSPWNEANSWRRQGFYWLLQNSDINCLKVRDKVPCCVEAQHCHGAHNSSTPEYASSVRGQQEAQRDTIAAFEEFMDSCLEAEWGNSKRAFIDAAMPDPHSAAPMDSALAHQPGPAGQALPAGELACSGRHVLCGCAAQLLLVRYFSQESAAYV